MDYVFSFEADEAGPDLDLMPLAARRALDHAGLHLPLEGWRSLSVDERKRITRAGGQSAVDVSTVATIVSYAKPAARPIDPIADPTAEFLPVGLSSRRGMDAQRWATLGGLERYALAHAAERALKRGKPKILTTAIESVLARAPEPVSSRAPSIPSDPKQLSTHIGPSGDVRMVDVAEKQPTRRRAVATSRVRMSAETVERLLRGDTPKGEVLATARIAGIMAAKRTPDIIPMCHAIALSHVEIQIDIDKPSATALITARAEAVDRTGVEMEAMVAASIAALTMYDMLKGIDREMVVEQVMLVEKSGGRSGHFRRST